ncbi:MAG: hypothetical protein MUC82_00190 [Cypionkella sp.]|jgi:hypothetical protein|nr:hypothetical protein [Cypionkella sp.]
MRILTLSAAALALTAGLAAANPGVDQLAAEAGVAPGVLTQAQLIRLIDAQRDNDDATVRFILSQAGQADVTRSNMGAGSVSSDAQLAAAAGVAPGQYTTNELYMLIEARRDNDQQRADFILSGEIRNGASVDGSAAAKAQLAGPLGVNPDDYTLSELVQLNADLNRDS